MKLLVVESPAKAKTINKYLGTDEYSVLSSYGHIRAIPTKDNAVEVCGGDIKIRYDILPSAEKNIAKLVQASKSASTIYFATDPDREGEAISWHLLEVLKQRGAISDSTQLKRIVFHEITLQAVHAAIKQPRDIDLHLVHAQQARQALDYIVGFTLSPILWRKLPGSRSAGRVQSVALKIICERESEIESFEKLEYWKVHGLFCGAQDVVSADGSAGVAFGPSTDHCVSDDGANSNLQFQAELAMFGGKSLGKLSIAKKEQAEAMVDDLKQRTYHVQKVDVKKITNSPKPPFTTSTLLQEASYRLNFSSKKTSLMAQRLYEGVDIQGKPTALITYMRTDSVYVSNEAARKANALIIQLYGRNYAPENIRSYKNKIKNAQEAHEAIRPVDVDVLPEAIKSLIDDDLYRLYELIWRRFVASQMSNAVLDVTTVKIVDDASQSQAKPHALFKASGSVVLFHGYRRVYGVYGDVDAGDGDTAHGKRGKSEGDDCDDHSKTKDAQLLPRLCVKQRVDILEVQCSEHQTKPQSRFSEASLVKKMEELGIGRPSTYPTIISILQDRQYVTLKNKQFTPEPRGRLVNAFLSDFFGEYVQYEFTAQMENMLDEISRGEKEYKDELVKFWTEFKEKAGNVIALKTADVLRTIEGTLVSYMYGVRSGNGRQCGVEEINQAKKCPTCNIGMLTLKNSRFSPFIGCNRYPECTFIRQFSGCDAAGNEKGGVVGVDESARGEWPRVLGVDVRDGHDVLLNNGPYGFYVMKKIMKSEAVQGSRVVHASNEKDNDHESTKRSRKKKPGKQRDVKIVGVPKGVSPNDVTLPYALKLLDLPKIIGQHPDDGANVVVGIGRYGPYVQHNRDFFSIKSADFTQTTLCDALELMSKKGNTRKAYKVQRKV